MKMEHKDMRAITLERSPLRVHKASQVQKRQMEGKLSDLKD